MCGIIGYVGIEHPKNILLDGLKNLEYRGYDYAGIATHGEVSEVNAHPHMVGNIILVHNGIIENAKELRKKLQQENVSFKTNTDTEVVAALINKYYENNEISAISKAVRELKGSYALGILFKDSDKLYAVRKDSPLIIGVSDKEKMKLLKLLQKV